MLDEHRYKIVNGKYITAAVVIINSDGDILGCRTTGRGKYDFPKGMVEDYESDVEGAVRELVEETGIIISTDNLIDCGLYPHGNSEKFIHIFLYQTDVFPDLDDLECTSYFERDGKSYPEVDGYSIIKKDERFKFNKILQDKFNIIDKFNKQNYTV